MHKKIIKISLVLLMMLTLTGCTKYLETKDEETGNKKVVINEITGQKLTKNILCQPEEKELIKIYKENGVKLDKYPHCEEMKITSGNYEGIWTTIFVKPLAWLIIQVGTLVKNYGLAIVIITLLIRIIMLPITKKTALQSENMKAAKPELDKLEKKYKDKNDQLSQQQKAQEMLMIYKKYNISPLSGCLFAFIQIPLFFAFFEALNRLPAVFEEKFIGFQLGTSPIVGINNGDFQYIIIITLVLLTTYFSFKLGMNSSGNELQDKSMKMMTYVMVGMIAVASLQISTGIAIYWIVNSSFTVIQTLLVKRRKKHGSKK